MIDAQEWDRCRHWIVASIAASPLADNIETIEAKLAGGTYRLEASPNAAAIVEFASFDGRPALIVRFGGGSIDELLDEIEPRLYVEAKAQGRMMLSEGRLGWLKPAKARGYRLAWITMVKD